MCVLSSFGACCWKKLRSAQAFQPHTSISLDPVPCLHSALLSGGRLCASWPSWEFYHPPVIYLLRRKGWWCDADLGSYPALSLITSSTDPKQIISLLGTISRRLTLLKIAICPQIQFSVPSNLVPTPYHLTYCLIYLLYYYSTLLKI